MNTYVTLACLLAVFGLCQGNPVGYGIGAPWIGHALPAISTANFVKAAPIPVIRTHIAPVITTPIVTPVVRTVNVGYGLGGYGLGGYGLGGLGWGGLGLGYGGLGYSGMGWGGHGAWGGWGKH